MNIEKAMNMKSLLRIPAVALALFAAVGVARASDLGDLPDPTHPSGAATGGGVSGLTSILVKPGRKQAVIHGRTVTIGDRVDGAVVVDIRPYEVILKREGRESRMRLVPRLDKLQGEGGSS